MSADHVSLQRIASPGQRAAERVWRAPNHHPAVLLLRPFSALFGLTVRARRIGYQRGWLHSERAPLPVISVGNLTVGGSGKTPFTRWLTERLLERGQKPAILHGGSAQDEPALHRAWHPNVLVLAERDRTSAARAAAAQGATVALLDDGLQHMRLARDLEIVLVSADRWHEPQRLLPSGAWREPLAVLRNADAVVVTRKAASAAEAAAVHADLAQHLAGRAAVSRPPVLSIAAIELTDFVTLRGQPSERPAEGTVLCGIADPLSFVRQLENVGVRVAATLACADHHAFSLDDLRLARSRAGSQAVVITEKDAVKIAALDPTFPAVVARQRVRIDLGEAEIRALVERVIS